MARSTWVPVLVVWALSRAFFFVVGAVGHAVVPQAHVIGAYREPVGALGYWAHWDGRWFAHIAMHGYDTVQSTAFFPAYPLLVRGGIELGLGIAVAGVVISTVASLAAFYFVYELARRWFDDRAALAAILTLAFFPTAFFLNAVYSDPLFLALTAGAMWSTYVRGDILVAGLFGYVAAATRNAGVLLALPLAYEWFRDRRRFGLLEGIVGIAGPLVGLATYVIFLWRAAGEPLLFSLAYRQGWGTEPRNPLATLLDAVAHADDGLAVLWPPRVLGTSSINPPFALSNTLGVVFLAFALATVALAARRVPLGALLYAIPVALGPLVMGLSGLPLISYPRYVIVVFPCFIALGAVLARRRVALALWVVCSAAIGAYLTLLFVSWRWVA